MAAFAKDIFKKGFVLDEERLRKIHELLSNRLETLPDNLQPIYKVYRADAFYYTTPNLQDVLKEENLEWQRIERITIEAQADEQFQFNLNFDKTGIKLNIEGDDRDFVYLLFSDLRQYISGEVDIHKRYIGEGIPILFLLLMVVITAVLLISPEKKPTASDMETNKVIQSNDTNEKLNYILEKTIKKSESDIELSRSEFGLLIAIVVAAFAGFLIFAKNLRKINEHLFPRNAFLFGKQAGLLERSKELRGKLVWGIGVAIVVGVISSLIAWVFTKS